MVDGTHFGYIEGTKYRADEGLLEFNIHIPQAGSLMMLIPIAPNTNCLYNKAVTSDRLTDIEVGIHKFQRILNKCGGCMEYLTGAPVLVYVQGNLCKDWTIVDSCLSPNNLIDKADSYA